MATLALAQDNAFGQPLESQLRSCLLAGWLCEAAGHDEDVRAAAYWVALLRYVGCTSHSHEVAALFGDDIAIRAQSLVHDAGEPSEVVHDVLDHVTRIDESLDNLRDMENSATQTNLSLITLAESEVTKKLAGWGAILMVPSIVGTIYGMNFKHMPELEWAYGYPAALVLMAVGGAALWAFFRKIQWV